MRIQVQSHPQSKSQPPAVLSTGGVLQRKCACGQHTIASGECAECHKRQLGLRRWATNQTEPTTVPPIVHEVLRSPGQPLDAATRAFMEPRFGHNFSQVRVHTDAKAVESARVVDAFAYTVGRDVVFGAGQYAPQTLSGQRLLAHELTHVVQQRGGTFQDKVELGQPGNVYEQEAERISERVKSGNRGTLDGIQISGPDDAFERFAELTVRQASERDVAEGTEGAMNKALAINVNLASISSTNRLLLQRKCAANSNEEFYRASPNYCEDTGFTGLFHRGQRCYREVPKRSGYFECPAGDQVCFDDQGGCHDSPDKVSPVEKKNPDGTCNLHFVCSLGHGVVDVIPPILAKMGQRELRCLKICEKQPWYIRGFCFQGCSPPHP